MGKNKLVKQNVLILKTLDETKNFIGQRGGNNYDPDAVLRNVKEKLNKTNSLQKCLENLTAESDVFKALTLFEFDKGILGTLSVSEEYRTFFVDFTHSLQKEYQCQTQGEKSLCHLAAISYMRMLDSQRIITNVLARGKISDDEVRIVAVMGKEADRSTRQYLTAFQSLQTMKQPTLNVNIKTQTAVLGQNQIVQSNNK